MEKIRSEIMANPNKMLPPGRLFHVNRPPRPKGPATDLALDMDFDDDSLDDLVIHEVGPDFFKELILSPWMFDISRHLPSLYEDTLRDLIERERTQDVEEVDHDHAENQ